jgi:hypothetical protein
MSEPVAATTITLVEGASFAICDDRGDIGYHGVDALFVADTRIGSRLVLTVDDQAVERPRSPVVPTDRSLLALRNLWAGGGMRVDVRLRNLTSAARTAVMRLPLGADLAQLFAVKEGRARTGPVAVSRTAGDGSCVSPAPMAGGGWWRSRRGAGQQQRIVPMARRTRTRRRLDRVCRARGTARWPARRAPPPLRPTAPQPPPLPNDTRCGSNTSLVSTRTCRVWWGPSSGPARTSARFGGSIATILTNR